MKIRSNPETVHPPVGAYTHQIQVQNERLLVIAGQIGMTPEGSVPEAAAEQLELALANVRSNLEAAGMAPADLIKLTIFLTEEISGDERRRIMETLVGDEPPAATLVYISRLARPDLKAEVEAVASAP